MSPDQFEKVGLQGVFETAQFQQGLNQYLSGIARAASETSQVAGMIGSAAGQIGLGIMTNLGGQVLQVIENFGAKLFSSAEEAVMGAARYNELILVAQLLGEKMGYTSGEIDDFIAGVRKTGIEAATAAQTVAEFAKYQLDLSKATDLARAAQDLAVVSGSNSTETLARLQHGILTQQVEVLRMAGITVDATQAMDKYAKSINTTADALTGNQRTQAMMNAVLEEAKKSAGAYLIAMTNPFKLLQSLPRILDDISISIGAPIQEGFGKAVLAIYDFAKAISAAMAEGGALYPVLQKIGAVAAVVGDAFNDLVTQATPAITSWMANTADSFLGMAADAFTWGVNIVTELAAGIIEGAAGVLTFAMNEITVLLTWWMAPGSPPKVAPYLPEWGAAAITSWLKGFASADFSVLKSIQTPIKSALDLLVGEGLLDKATAGKLGVGLTQAIANALRTVNAGGTVGPAFYAMIADATGEYGAEIALLVKDQLELAAATNAATAAQKALEAAQKKEFESLAHADTLRREYNKMLRGGASQAALAAKLAEIQAAEKAAKAAGAERKEAEKNVVATADQVALIKERVAAQQALVDQLIELAKAQITPVEAAAGGGKAGGKAALPGGVGGLPGLPKGMQEGAGEGTLTPFQKLKKAAADALANIFAPVQEAWDKLNAPGGAIYEFQAAWKRLGDIVRPWYDQNIKPWLQPLLDSLALLFGPDWVDKAGRITGVAIALGVLAGVVTLITGLLASPVVAIGLLVLAIAALWSAWDTDWQGMRTIATLAATIIGATVVLLAENFWAGIKTVGEALQWLVGQAQIAWGQLVTAWRTFGATIEGLWTAFWAELQLEWDKFWGVIGAKLDELHTLGSDLIQGFIDGIRTKFEAVRKSIEELAGNLPEWIKKILGITSPSTVMIKIGADAVKGLEIGMRTQLPNIERMAQTLSNTVQNRSTLTPSMVTNRTVNLNFGNNNISNGMSLEAFESRVKRIVTEMI